MEKVGESKKRREEELEVVEMKILCASLGVTGVRSVRNASEVRGASEMKPESPDWPGYAWVYAEAGKTPGRRLKDTFREAHMTDGNTRGEQQYSDQLKWALNMWKVS